MDDHDRDWVVKYFERVIGDQDRRIEQALEAAREAVDKAEKAQERRLDLLNEFRSQSQDEQSRFAQRDVVEPRIDKVESAVQKAYGGLIVIGAVGLANLIRIWTG